jgi:hypothetical protein
MGGYDSSGNEVLDIDFLNCSVRNFNQPAGQPRCWMCLDVPQKCVWVPANPDIAFANLHYRAAQRADADDRVKVARSIPHQEHHGPAGNTPILIGPRVAKIAPNVHQSHAR